MKAPVFSRKTHKWLTLVIGVQALLWMVSGAYMVTMDLDFIHGDPLVRNMVEDLEANFDELYPIDDILAEYDDAESVDVVSRQGEPYYVVNAESGSVLLDARSGVQRSPLPETRIVSLAEHFYAGNGTVNSIRLLTADDPKPSEIQTRPLPLWQVSFDDRIRTTFYLSPSTGELITRRHTFWRAFDFLWMFHIMDYENRSDVNNTLLRVASAVGVVTALSGVWLLIFSLRRHRPAIDHSPGGPPPHGSFDDSAAKTT
jgi:Na+-transporting NADH:ubiquinone oxidoreductase subunit F